LNQAIRYAEQPSQDLQVRRQQLGVAEAIGDIQNHSELPALNTLLASQNVSLRRAAAKALRGMSDPSIVSFLVRALDDSDADVQYDAVMALAAIAGASTENAPARDIFNQDPAKYVGYWKNCWLASHK
jgi:HEAT repeat protein